MFIFGMIVGLIVGGAIGAGVVYAWKVRGKILVRAEDILKVGVDKAKEVAE